MEAYRNTDQGTQDPPDEAPRLSPDGPDEDAVTPEVEVELRPQRRLRIWQLAPIVMLAAIGSLMFAFPLAFGTGDGGAVVAMLGLLISCCAAGWGMMAARRVGHAWPGRRPAGPASARTGGCSRCTWPGAPRSSLSPSGGSRACAERRHAVRAHHPRSRGFALSVPPRTIDA